MDLKKYSNKNIVDTWSKICLIADGMAISTTVNALKTSGILDFIYSATLPVKVDDMIAIFKIKNRGYFHLTFRLLEDQGIIERFGDIYKGYTKVLYTKKGNAWHHHLNDYNSLPKFLKLTTNLLGDKSSMQIEIGEFAEYLNDFNKKPKIEQTNKIHVISSFFAVFLKKLKGLGFFNNPHGETFTFDINQLKLSDIAIAEIGFNFMVEFGWIKIVNTNKYILTEKSALVQQFLPQIDFTLSYLTTAFNVPKLLFNQLGKTTGLGELENHIDRLLDVNFSGGVYLKHCRKQTHEIIQKIFNKLPVNEQPKYIVDTGSGNGIMLIDIYNYIKNSTVRGRSIDEYPIMMVGVEFTQVAKEITEKNLQDANIPHLTVFGDITYPDQIIDELNKHDIKSDDILHISKSVIHNRTYIEPEMDKDYYNIIPTVKNVFVSKKGELITANNLEANLFDHFVRWKKWTQKHGILVIEAHSINPNTISKTLGNNVFTAFDAEHGYSNQYLIEHEAFLEMAIKAGFDNSEYNGVIFAHSNEVILSINYFQNTANS